ncbi:DUF551 domain-containing protein [Undibacterium sp. MH2W]|uniref:DUF551 domain-containing protein n=1 Tax=Undibacterium sp. MH2W TaxID=3413044 RepID=UPI003BF0B5F6
MIKTITINTETHKVVPIEPTEEFFKLANIADFESLSGSCCSADNETIYRCAIESAPEFSGSSWINAKDRLPDVKAGNCEEFIVHARSINGGKARVFAAMYLNEMELDDSEEGYERPFTGWHSAKEHHDYDCYYEAISSHEILHWMPLPTAPEGV